MANLSETNVYGTSRDRIIWGVAACLTVALVWRIVSGVQSIRPPFADKDKVLDSIPWGVRDADGDSVNDDNYAWLDNETVIYALSDGQQKYKLMRQKIYGEQTLPAESVSNIKPLNVSYVLSVSPNGKWLAVEDCEPNGNYLSMVYDINGGGLKQSYPSADYFASWMADSKSFVKKVHRTQEITQYWVEMPKRKPYTLPQIYYGGVVVSPKGEFFASNYTSRSHPKPELERGSIFTGKSQVQIIPTYGLVLNSHLYSISPQGDRLLWYQEWSGKTTWFAELTGKLTGDGAIPVNYEAWYVTDSDGKNPRTWARAHNRNIYHSHSLRISLFPKWLPDGKHLSVVYKGALYVVPVP